MSKKEEKVNKYLINPRDTISCIEYDKSNYSR